ncbi:metal-binding-domain/4Fe-4S-binding-domain containing ABC transporter, ATP-binding protein [Candidatus Nitrososphaera evergladensis SR1]|jgi:diphthine-ammonia ligase|uniref:Metal-binding-domain/4Fe-4S-binding-domain containing ABC transporter, ATP-binding protein n=1 Tax=Candidatus Nitrososphaera evergladensis SR1 TaxID=1459636 RepID=A0A075MNR6_9ARCH|nr:diphthine--ammonia ligase [Candidatus Nitrososphaera evergladensis]AIF82853.1 metal-binding-domain/4Fe-4S-binding-domain containing ABC transporter, ATP-binding protein [Candidatus Nitrososphaera evergladensis SR1]
MRLAALFSGGKDSTFAIYRARQAGHAVECLITMHPAADDSALFHYPNSRVTRYLAEAMKIPLLESAAVTGTDRDAEIKALAAAVAQAKLLYRVEGIVNGGIASVFQKQAFEEACKEHGLVPVSPLWGAEPEKYMADLLASGFTVMIVGISAMGLEKEWLGKVIDGESLAKLVQLSKKYGFNLAFEGGEAETLVLDCPLYSKRLAVGQATAKWDGQRGIFEILEAELVNR